MYTRVSERLATARLATEGADSMQRNSDPGAGAGRYSVESGITPTSIERQRSEADDLRELVEWEPRLSRLEGSMYFKDAFNQLHRQLRRGDFRRSTKGIIFEAVAYGLSPTKADLMTATARRALIARFKKHAIVTAELLEILFAHPASFLNETSVPDEFHVARWELEDALVKREAETIKISASDHGLSEETVAEVWRHAGRSFMSESVPEFLRKISAAGHLWVNSSSVLLRKPMDRNAGRLYFLRSLTRDFAREFGSPMRRAVLSLASFYFACHDLSETDVSKLAPIPKNRETTLSRERRYWDLRTYLDCGTDGCSEAQRDLYQTEIAQIEARLSKLRTFPIWEEVLNCGFNLHIAERIARGFWKYTPRTGTKLESVLEILNMLSKVHCPAVNKSAGHMPDPP